MKRVIAALLVFGMVITIRAAAERELFAPSVLAPTATAGTIEFGDGTASAPSMSFSADNNTGIYRPATDTIGFTTNGNLRAAIDGYNMCIGNNVAASVPQNGTLSATSGSGTNIAGASMTIRGGNSTGNAAGGHIAFQTAPAGASGSTANTLTERMRITSDGTIVVGNGETNASPASGVLRATGGSGTNIAGAVLGISGGTSTGNASGGSISFRTSSPGSSGSNTNSATEKFSINAAGVFAAASGSYVDAGAGKLELPNGTALPATCTVGEVFQDTDSNDCANTAGGDGALCICKTTNTWALIANF